MIKIGVLVVVLMGKESSSDEVTLNCLGRKFLLGSPQQAARAVTTKQKLSSGFFWLGRVVSRVLCKLCRPEPCKGGWNFGGG